MNSPPMVNLTATNTGAIEENRIEQSYPFLLRQAERGAIDQRRQEVPSGTVAFENGPDSLWPDTSPGLAISGGGIRSATFALGLLQAMARNKFLRTFDFMSTVSGGSYIGSFLGRIYTRKQDYDNYDVPAENMVDTTEALLSSNWSPALYWARENGEYLSPSGDGDYVAALAAWFRDWLTIQLLIGCMLVMLLLFYVGCKTSFIPYLWDCKNAYDATVLTAYPLSPPAKLDVGWRFVVKEQIMPVTGMPVLLCLAAGFFISVTYWILVFITFGLHALWPSKESAKRKKLWRRRWTEVLGAALLLTIGAVILRIVDEAGFWLYRNHSTFFAGTTGAGLATAAGAVTRFLIPKVLAKESGNGISLNMISRLAAPAGLVLLISYASVAAGIAYYATIICRSGNVYYAFPHNSFYWAFVLLTVNVIVGRFMGFVNLTSLHVFYSSRLARAYLGASNPDRWDADGPGVTDPHELDDVAFADYMPHQYGGPLHIINATLNETYSGHSNIDERDRKGLALAVSPLAISAGVSHHARREPYTRTLNPLNVLEGYNIFQRCEAAEDLTLAQWVAISGAAFSTGMGQSTSTGFSIFLGFFNIRMGYWWRSRTYLSLPPSRVGTIGSSMQHFGDFIKSCSRHLFKAQSYLIMEWLGRFAGPSFKHWYLSDGGHFENIGVYELIRRQLPLIVAMDDGEDGDSQLESLGNLIRRARTDFGAETAFFSDGTSLASAQKFVSCDNKRFWDALAELVHTGRSIGLVGGIEDLRSSGSPPKTKRHVAIGLIRYARRDKNQPRRNFGVFIYIRPSLTGDESDDVLTYSRMNTDFPQQSTLDQFFDEAQWESYRKLGEHIGSGLMQILSPAMAKALMSR